VSPAEPCPGCGEPLDERGRCLACESRTRDPGETLILAPPSGAGPEALAAEPAGEFLASTPLPEELSVVLDVVDGPDRGVSYALSSSAVTLGREEGDLLLDDPLVSRRHAVIEVYGAAFVLVKDLTSTNGTFLNGRMIAYGRLADGDELRLGDTRLVVSIDRRAR
jgi:predicted component of type VI protein secretion system